MSRRFPAICWMTVLVTGLGSPACKSKNQGAQLQDRSPDRAGSAKAPPLDSHSDYGAPIGARVTGSEKVPSFEVALAAKGAEPDDCLPLIIQALSTVSQTCPALVTELLAKGLVTVTLETNRGALVPELTRSTDFDEPSLNCLRAEFRKTMSHVPQQQQVRYLLQVRPLAS